MKRFCTVLQIMLFVCASSAWSQVATGSLSGTVVDAVGAAIPGAAVVAKNEATGVEFKTESSEAGLYVFATLPTGVYGVTAEKTGFKKSVRSGIEIRIATRQELDVRMEIGEVQQTVEVTGEAQLLEG